MMNNTAGVNLPLLPAWIEVSVSRDDGSYPTPGILIGVSRYEARMLVSWWRGEPSLKILVATGGERNVELDAAVVAVDASPALAQDIVLVRLTGNDREHGVLSRLLDDVVRSFRLGQRALATRPNDGTPTYRGPVARTIASHRARRRSPGEFPGLAPSGHDQPR